jgi:hypothetical protein
MEPSMVFDSVAYTAGVEGASRKKIDFLGQLCREKQKT